MATNGKQRRRTRGSAWHWRQTDGWYYTPPGTKRRVPLLDEDGKRIRGKENRQVAELALARVKVAGDWRPEVEPVPGDEWLVARVCSEYIERCQQGAAAKSISEEYADEVARRLNQLCEYCGSLPVSQLTKGHVEHWAESQAAWQSPVTRRNAITIVLAAFNHARDMHDVEHRLKGTRSHRLGHDCIHSLPRTKRPSTKRRTMCLATSCLQRSTPAYVRSANWLG